MIQHNDLDFDEGFDCLKEFLTRYSCMLVSSPRKKTYKIHKRCSLMLSLDAIFRNPSISRKEFEFHPAIHYSKTC